jgi:hypothetical protein
MNGTYHLILTSRFPGAFQHGTMTVGNSGEGVHNIILDAGNDGVGVRDIVTNGRNGCICGCRKCLLGAGS